METHEHIYGRGANGRCRVCGAESRNGRDRRLRRERKAAEPKPPAKPFSLYDALCTKDGKDPLDFK